MKNIDSRTHTTGESIYVDDIPVMEGTLHAAIFGSPSAHGIIKALDLSEAEALAGVAAVLTARDIPGQNQIGGIIADETLFADGEVHFMGEPVAMVLADTEGTARAAVRRIRIDIDERPVVVDPREAAEKGELIQPPRTFSLGDTDSAWEQCDHVFSSTADTGGQEHLYIETQGAYAFPNDRGGVRISSSTQGPTSVQRATAKVLGLPMHAVEVDVNRLGGGFGGKEDQATAWAAMAALGALTLKRPVKLVLHRMDDMQMTGKRHPYDSDFKIGLTRGLKILAYEATYYQNAGACADLSPAILERTLFHCTNSYFIPNVKATAYSCRTHLVPNTAFRGFGGPQGMFVMESAIAAAAESLGVEAADIQKANLLEEGNPFPYGQTVEGCNARACWDRAESLYEIDGIRREVEAFNADSKQFKKGVAVMPICFGISFTNTAMNQASALVHIYNDGSVGVSTAAVEMGQGVNTKMVQVAARTLSISPDRVKMETTNTTRVANTSPTAASSGSDLNGIAVLRACETLSARLLAVAAEELGRDVEGLALKDERVYADGEKTELEWKRLVMATYSRRVSLSEQAFYATPGVHFDSSVEKGAPFAYHVFGSAIHVATLDCLRGTYEIDAVRVVHDFGKSMNVAIDRGQAEGAIVQGIGWMTMEELMFDEKGRLLSNSLSTYKVPDIYGVPNEIDVDFLDTEGSPLAIFKSKAIGEPPLMYGIGAYFAIRNAVRAFRPGIELPFSAPLTPEKALLYLYKD